MFLLSKSDSYTSYPQHIAYNNPTPEQFQKAKELYSSGYRMDEVLSFVMRASVFIKLNSPTWVLDTKGGIVSYEDSRVIWQ
jgi:hypothetical protein